MEDKKMQQPRRWLLGMLCLVYAGFLFAQEQDVRPGINENFRHPDFATWVERFEHEGREVYDKRMQIVRAVDLKPGMRIADVGAGTGLFSKLFSPAVGDKGKVYAEDISDVFVHNIERIAKQEGLHNLHGVIGTDKDTRLPSDSMDRVFVCDTYHHFEYPQTMLASIRKAMKADGRLIIVDFIKDPALSSGWILQHVRADKATVIKEIEQAGFQLLREESFLHSNYFLVFSKRE
jgi:ubiquinone/menaquinone biosynthesis C-methylase UbiE